MGGDSFIQSHPWIQWKTFYTLSQNKDYKDIVDNIKDKEIRAYCDGWLVIEDMKMHLGKKKKIDIKMHHLYLINVKSSEKIQLPSLNSCYDTCILTCSPTDLGCHVLFTTKDTIRYCRPGDKKYKTHKLEERMHIKDDMVAVLEGKVYYVMDSAFPNLVMIECNGSTLQFTQMEILPFFINEVLPYYSPYLVESGGELLLVLKSYRPICPKEHIIDVDFFVVFQFDFVNMSWMRVDDIGNSTIFLSPKKWYGDISCYGATSFCATEPQIKRNSIYFLQNDDEYVHVYDMNNHLFSLFSNGLKTTLHVQEELNENLFYEKQNIEFLPQMHSDVSKLVLARVFTLDPGALGVIRSTCKDWGSFVRPPTSAIDLRYNKYPYLVTLINGRCHFFHPTYDHTFYLDIPELLGSNIIFSKFGWLLLSRKNKETEKVEYFFFNPFTRQKMSLPNPDPLMEFVNMSFSSPPTSSHCFVVAVDFFGAVFAIFKCGEDSWKTFETLRVAQRAVNNYPVFYKQKCYFCGLHNNLIVVDLATRNLFVVGKTYSAELPVFDECFLVKDGKGLLGVFLTSEKKTPYLMRMDLSQTKKTWQPVQNLNNKMVYVSRAACRSVSAPTSSTGNKIYFPLFQNSSSIFYSLSTGKYHSFSGNYSCETPFEVQRMTNCAWIDVK